MKVQRIKKAVLAVLIVPVVTTSAAGGVLLSDDFESGNLNKWVIGGRQGGVANVAEVISRGGSQVGHLYHKGFTETTIERTFSYDPKLRFSFDMEAYAVTTNPVTGGDFSKAGADFTFLDGSGNFLGRVGYNHAGTSYLFDYYNSLPQEHYFAIAEGAGVISYNVSAQELLTYVDVDPASVVSVEFRFIAYTSGWYYSETRNNMYGDVWVDNVVVTSPGLIAHWKFDEGEGDIAYDSAGSNHGTIHGATWTTGIIDGALDFDGVDDYVEIGNDTSLNITNEISLTAWVKPKAFLGSEFIVSKWHDEVIEASYGMRLADENPRFFLANNTEKRTKTFTDLVINPDVWHHIVATWDGSTMRAYSNGVASTQTESFSDAINIADSIAAIGYSPSYGGGLGGDYFNGTIDDVAIYNRALTADEIQQLYEEGAGRLVAHWKFDEGEGDIAYDSAGTNHGTIHGATWTTGIIDGALDFDGLDDYVEIADSDNLTPSDALTISAWVYINELSWSDRTAILCKYDWIGDRAYMLQLGVNNEADKSIVNLHISQTTEPFNGKGTAGSTQLQPGRWYYIAATFEANHQEIYVNGVEEADDTDPAIADSIPNNNLPVYIGYNKDENTYFNGKIDDVRTYARALSPDEIQQLYTGGCLGDISDTSGWGDPDGKVNIGDLNALVIAMLTAYADGDDTGLYDIDLTSLPIGADCSDTTGFGDPDGKVNIGDLNAILFAMLDAYPNGDPTGLYEVPCLNW